MSLVLAAGSALAAWPSLTRPELLTGEPVTVGNLRGTALIVLVLTVPLLLVGLWSAGRGSLRGLALWLGAVMALTYQAVLFCFGIPINALFLPYVAMLGLGAWTLIALTPVFNEAVHAPTSAGARSSRMAPAVLVFLALGNALVWLARAAPITWTGERPGALTEAGLITSGVWVQDLAFWIPAAVVIAVMTWRGDPRGQILTASMLTFYVIECLSVASDQWWGVRADDSHPEVASMAAVPGAVVLGVLIMAPLVAQLRLLHPPALSRTTHTQGSGRRS
ncbi:MAG: hypothetical protein ACXWDM_00140 [Nocardioides sp.]